METTDEQEAADAETLPSDDEKFPGDSEEEEDVEDEPGTLPCMINANATHTKPTETEIFEQTIIEPFRHDSAPKARKWQREKGGWLGPTFSTEECSNGVFMFSTALTQTQRQKRVAPFKPQECAAEIASYDCFHFQDT